MDEFKNFETLLIIAQRAAMWGWGICIYLLGLVLPEAWRVVTYGYRHISIQRESTMTSSNWPLTVISVEAQKEYETVLWHSWYASIIMTSHRPFGNDT